MSDNNEQILDRIKKLEREVERLRVKESPGAWLDWTPTVTGWAAGYTCIARYCKVGKLCFVYLRISGTSDATDAKASLPLSVSSNPTFAYNQVPFFVDNNTTITTGGRCFVRIRPSDVGTDPNYVWFLLDGSETGWTSSNTKTVTATFFYEVA